MLLQALLHTLEPLRSQFFQRRTYLRFVWFMIAYLCAPGRRRTLSVALPEGQDHSAFYRLFSRDLWSLTGLFDEVIRAAVPFLGPKPYVPVALDDTLLKKVGRIGGLAQWLFDGLSRWFKPHLSKGLRWVHAALLVFIPGEGPLALSIALALAMPLRRPSKKSPPELWARYRKEAPRHSLPTKGCAVAGGLREALDRVGLNGQTLMMVVDGSYMNRRFLESLPERTSVIGRVRKDIRLAHPAPEGARRNRVYGDPAPTPEELRRDEETPWVRTQCYFGGAQRPVRYKELAPVLWRTVTARRPVRVLVVGPTPYWLPGRRAKGYNQPAYLLTFDLATPASILIQTYLERWQIEVLHRELKSELGWKEPQVWNRESVLKVTPTIAAFYAFLRIAALRAFGPGRDPAAYGDLPAYRQGKGPPRASPRDLLHRLRTDVNASPDSPIRKIA